MMFTAMSVNIVIDGAVSSSYTPPTNTVNNKPMMPNLKGNRWYKCVVTYTANGRAYQVESDVAAIHLDALTVATPVITIQPADAEYTQGCTPQALSIEASVTDNGTLSYQWYSNSNDNNEGGNPIDGADETQYIPSSAAAGTVYYYCEVTNAIQTLSETAVSDTASVTVASLSDETGWAGSGTADAPYLLEEDTDLVVLRDLVNQGYAMDDMVFQMNGDITLPGGWAPIGTLKDGATSAENGINILPFSGVFDGGENTLTVPEDGLPLFNYVRNATIRNLNIYGTKIAGYGLINTYTVDYGSDGDYQTGVPKAVLIDNVTIKLGSNVLYSGFISGYASGGNTVTIRNCTVEEGVVIGYEKTRSAIGSFAGLLNGTINNCVSYATVYGVNSVGGLVGVKGQSMGLCSIKNSAFCGELVATGSRVGGIIGSGYDGSGTAPNTPVVTVMNCYVAADITGADQIGGILGSEPGCECCWDNGVGSVSNNHYYGTITATTSNATAGGIIGFLKSFNKYQGIENNYYLDTCGTAGGIGDIEDIITTSHARYGADFGIDYEFNADDFCIAASTRAFADESITVLLNNGEDSSVNWAQGEDYPVFTDGPVLLAIALSGSYKTDYVLGDSFISDGMTVTAFYSDNSSVPVSLEDVRFSGFDSDTRGVKTITVKYMGAQTSYTVLVLSGETGNIIVSFTLLGAPADGENGGINTLRYGNLDTWIEKDTYVVSVDATVRDVFETALTEAGLSWENPSGNYVKSITNGDTTLAEFTNGDDSGWMYTLNGTHSLLGVNEQYLSNGDVIVFHYTDDYTVEEGSENWNTGTDDATITPETTVSNGQASASVGRNEMGDAIGAAKDNGEPGVKITATATDDVTKSTVTLPSGSAADIAGAGLSLTVETSTGTFDIDNNALQTIAGAGSGDVALTAEELDAGGLSDANQALVGDHPVFDLGITVGGENVTDFGDGTVTVSLPYTPADGEDTANLTVYYIDGDGNAVEMTGAVYDEETGVIVFETDHFSVFAVVYADWENPFTDVTEDDWFYDEVAYVVTNGLFNGTGDTVFAPDMTMTRAMFATVLYRLDGEPAVTAENPFDDVEDGEWYTDAVIWANNNGIVEGYGEGIFGTNDDVTREQMAKMLYSYADYKGYDVTASADLSSYTDADEISDWALAPMRWANAEEVITGRTITTLVPLGGATRAEVATIVMRFVTGLS